MTTFESTAEFDCSPDRLLELLEDDEEFRRRLGEATEMRREIVEDDPETGLRRTRCVSMRDIPGLMQKALGIEQFEYDVERRLDRDRRVSDWKVVTPFMTDRVEAGGTTRIEAMETGSRRVVEGEVAIQLPMVGSKMEEKFADMLRESFEEGASIAREMSAGEE